MRQNNTDLPKHIALLARLPWLYRMLGFMARLRRLRKGNYVGGSISKTCEEGEVGLFLTDEL